MEDLIKALNALVEVEQANARRMDRIIGLLEKEQQPFLEADEAARLIGLRVTRSGTHKRYLKWFRDKCLLTKFSCENPYTYEKEEVEAIAQRVKAGQIVIPPLNLICSHDRRKKVAQSV